MFALCLDDLRLFGPKYNDLIIQYATSSQEALKFLEENFELVSEIWFDFDLSGDDTATPVIDWLDEKACKGEANHITAIRILTSNPVAHQKIMLALGRHFFVGVTPHLKGIRGMEVTES